MNEKFWHPEKKRWNGHAAFNTVSHHHVSCYDPAEGHDTCDLTIVECADGRWYVEDNWGGDAQGAEGVWNPYDRTATKPTFFESESDARKHAVTVVARICGVPESKVSFI